MTIEVAQTTGQLGLLDLSVGLSVPEVYSGTEFTLYLHIKNPFARPVWIKSVELSLPTQLSFRKSGLQGNERSRPTRANERLIRRLIKSNETEIRRLSALLSSNAEADGAAKEKLTEQIEELRADTRRHLNRISGIGGDAVVHAHTNASIKFGRARASNLVVHAQEGSQVKIDDFRPKDEPERVPLLGSLPQGSALQPGSTDVWTIRLGSRRNPLFIPARYNLQLTVIYSLDQPEKDESDSLEFYSNTTAFTVPVRTALWSVIIGGLIGGIIGSCCRSLQNFGTVGSMFGTHVSATIAGLVLSGTLSGAAVIFSARKTETQTFITVEDFWGGVLVGFLIGYSGTAAFTKITGITA